MIDFTFLFLTVLMLLAIQSGMTWIAVALFVLLVFTAKNKYLLLSAIIGGVLVLLLYFIKLDYVSLLVVGGLFLVFLILASRDTGRGPQTYYGGY